MRRGASRRLLTAALVCCLAAAYPGAQAATIVIRNDDPPGVGLNSTSTQIKPAADNPGTTLGEQRLDALRFAARILGSKIKSPVTIVVAARFKRQNCGVSRATLGQGGFTTGMTFTNPPPLARRHVFYPIALANALAGKDADSGPDISVDFNAAIDNNSQCLGTDQGESVDWYYGYDRSSPTSTSGGQGRDLNFLSTAFHELIHGLGFETTTDLRSGQFPQGIPDVFATRIRDLTRQARWPRLSPALRARSATNDGNVVWDGPNTTAHGAPTLKQGTNDGQVQLYAPPDLSSGSSISHWDESVTPNALMEPIVAERLESMGGIGLSACALEDMGWQLQRGTVCPDRTDIGVSPRAVEMKRAVSGGAAVSTVEVTNSGGSPLTLGDVAQANPLAAPFSLSADDCSGKTLAPGKRCKVMVTYAPAGTDTSRDSFDVPPANAAAMSSVTVPVTGNRRGAEARADAADNGGGGGGGCVMRGGPASPGPAFPALIASSLFALFWRRKRIARSTGNRP